jgi:hypothetical protein
MYGTVTAMGFPSDNATNPVPVASGSCAGGNLGYVRYLTRDGTGTWNLQVTQLISPSTCAGDLCGTTVRVGSGGRILFSCPQVRGAKRCEYHCTRSRARCIPMLFADAKAPDQCSQSWSLWLRGRDRGLCQRQRSLSQRGQTVHRTLRTTWRRHGHRPGSRGLCRRTRPQRRALRLWL